MIEELFIERGNDGRARYTEMGRVQAELLGEYRELIGRLADFLKCDAPALAPSQDKYSPYGICYGFVADLLSNMALDTLLPQAPSGLSFEEMFASRGSLDAKLARARMWAELPKRAGERDHFYHSSEFAAQNFSRLMTALDARSLRKTDLNASNHPDARIYVVAESDLVESLPEGSLPAGISRVEEHCYTSNFSRALSGAMTAVPAKQILVDRNEGRFLASDEVGGEWFAVSKVILTLFTSQGRDVLISSVPRGIIDVLRLTCPGLIVTPAENSTVPDAASG
jgi:hypothetical protein